MSGAQGTDRAGLDDPYPMLTGNGPADSYEGVADHAQVDDSHRPGRAPARCDRDPAATLDIARRQLDLDDIWLARRTGKACVVVATASRSGATAPSTGSSVALPASWLDSDGSFAIIDDGGWPSAGGPLSMAAIRDSRGTLLGAVGCSGAVPRDGRLELLAAILTDDVSSAADGPGNAAIADIALRCAYQPIVRLCDDRVVGYEALTRFDDTSRPTADIFAAAAVTGSGVDDLELRALRCAVDQLPQIPDHLWLGVNLSPRAVFDPRVPELLEPVADRIVLEITEHAQVHDYAALRRRLWTLRQMGAKLSVDDAGAGFASFRHVLELRPDSIKLDADLTHGIDQDPVRRELADALVTFAHHVGTTLVAEGVETARERRVLLDLGVDHGQGYLFGYPEPLDAQLS